MRVQHVSSPTAVAGWLQVHAGCKWDKQREARQGARKGAKRSHLAAAAIDDMLLAGRDGRVGRAEEGYKAEATRLARRPVLHDHHLLRQQGQLQRQAHAADGNSFPSRWQHVPAVPCRIDRACIHPVPAQATSLRAFHPDVLSAPSPHRVPACCHSTQSGSPAMTSDHSGSLLFQAELACN